MTEEIESERFASVDIRTGRVLEATSFPEARKPSYRLLIDFGPLGLKKSSAQITALYRPEDLVGRNVIAVVNLKPRQIANFISEVLILGVPVDDGKVVLLHPDRDVEPGLRIS
ncbi:MAG: tRNA-binding protein [Thermoplasmata archaeon]|nr:tRNA-binding protein [Candidatus Sysuiplasma acidicola]